MYALCCPVQSAYDDRVGSTQRFRGTVSGHLACVVNAGGPALSCLHDFTGYFVAVHQSRYVRPFHSLNVGLCVQQDEISVRRYRSIARYFEKLPHVQPGTASGGEWREK